MVELTGKRLGQYQILEQIGKGGMATVFKAEQTSLGRVVAVKVLPVNIQHDETFRERFVQEARAVASMNHPHILPVYDFGESEEATYIVMEYVSGGTLQSKMGTPLSLDYTAKIIEQIGSALDYAHACGIIHRDVKPSNIMMRGDTALLADFGLAKMTESANPLTRSGVGIGTPEYMSPEQGQGGKVDWRTDLYSLGVVTYEMLTGHIPYEADSPLAVVIKHISEPPPHACTVNPKLPVAVDDIIVKALAKRPEDRFQKGSDLAGAIAQSSRGDIRLPVPVPPPAFPALLPQPAMPALPQDPSRLLQLVKDVVTYSLPAGLLLFLVFGPSRMILPLALLLSIVVFLALNLILNPPGRPYDPTRDEVRALLSQCAASVARIQSSGTAMRDGSAREQVERIASRGATIVQTAAAGNDTSLSDANRLSVLLAQIAQIVDLYVKISASRSEQRAPQQAILRACEEALAAWAEKGIAADVDPSRERLDSPDRDSQAGDSQ